jgi:hypothetical protein
MSPEEYDWIPVQELQQKRALSQPGTDFLTGIVDGTVREIQPGTGHVDDFQRVVALQKQNRVMPIRLIRYLEALRWEVLEIRLPVRGTVYLLAGARSPRSPTGMPLR